MSVRWLIPLVAVLACGGAGEPEVSTGRFQIVPLTRLSAGDSLFSITRPAAFAGVLPCADCDARETTLVLHPDGSYRVQERMRGEDEPNLWVEIGRWTVRRDTLNGADTLPARLTLLRDAGPQDFEMLSELRLRLLASADDAGQRTAASSPNELVRISAPGTLTGTLRVRGEFRYYADAATLVSCNGGVQLVVGGDSAYLGLEVAHGETMLGTDAATYVELLARLEQRPGMEDGTVVETVLVDSVVRIEPLAECAATRVRAQLAVGDWRMTAMDGERLPRQLAEALTPSLRFVLSEPTMFGNAGCNRFTSRAVLRGLDLIPGAVALTKRACEDEGAMTREATYGQMLGEGGWFRLDGTQLVFSRGGTERARFVRR